MLADLLLEKNPSAATKIKADVEEKGLKIVDWKGEQPLSVSVGFSFCLGDWLRDNDKPATRQVLSSPSVFDLGKRDRFGINAEFAAGSQRPDLREDVEDGCT